MKSRISIFYGLCCLIAVSVALVSGKGPSDGSFSTITRREIELLLADIAKTNPQLLKKLAEDPETKRLQIENLKQLLAFASQAVKDGMAFDPTTKQELESIRAEVIAAGYDKEVNKGKAAMPPFGYIGEDRVIKYWAEAGHEAEFQRFLNAKLAILAEGDAQYANRTITADEKMQARDVFSKIRIYLSDFERARKNGTISAAIVEKTAVQVKLQQAQFLSRLYSEKVADDTAASEAEISAYISMHSEIDPAKKRASAQSILERAKAGENFAVLANKFTEDPGNTGPNGTQQGGLYADVPQGRMVAPFEAAALTLEPGQVSPNLVETEFGFHIIKLEKKTPKKNGDGDQSLTYDVRHILISTSIKDPENPGARDVPVKDYARSKIEAEKEKILMDKIILANHISVPEDFTFPALETKPAPKKKPTKKRVVKKK